MNTTLKQTVSDILGIKVTEEEAKIYAETNYLDLVRFIHHEKNIEDLKKELKNKKGELLQTFGNRINGLKR